MNDLPGPRAISKEAARSRLPLALARLASAALAMIGFVAGFALAQSQSAPSPSPSPSTEASAPQASSTQQSPAPAAQAKPQSRRVAAPTVADVARTDKAATDAAGPEKVYTNNDVDALPPGGISIVGTPPSRTPAKPKPQPVDDTAQKAAYWKARFTAARQKLAADKKALPELQRQFEIERVQETIGDPDTGQLYSDTHMELLREIAATKAAILNDQKGLKDLREEFHESKGKPAWTR